MGGWEWKLPGGPLPGGRTCPPLPPRTSPKLPSPHFRLPFKGFKGGPISNELGIGGMTGVLLLQSYVKAIISQADWGAMQRAHGAN